MLLDPVFGDIGSKHITLTMTALAHINVSTDVTIAVDRSLSRTPAPYRLKRGLSAEKALYLSTNTFQIKQKGIVPEQRSVLA